MDSSSHVTDIETNTSRNEKHPVVASIEKLIDVLPDISPSCCIYKTPATICRLNKRVYTPQLVSLGPFHHGSQKLKGMEEHKLEYLKAFLHRTNLSLQDWMKKIQNWEKKVRDCYAERIYLKQDEFLRMVLVDSCFIMESILAYFKNIFSRKIYLDHADYLCMRDMVLLENQLPFFVLDGLYHLAFPDADETEFLEYSIRFFYSSTLMHEGNQDELIGRVNDHVREGHKILHFVDLLRLCHLPTSLRDTNSSRRVSLVTIPQAAELQGAGIKLKSGSSKFTLDLKYADGALEIPPLTVDEDSEYVISNILVLEMCHYQFDSYVTDYIFFMEQLIDTPKDVDLLIEKGIIENESSDSSAVANLFNNVGYDFPVIVYKYYFYDVSQELNAYCSVPWHKWKAAFKRDYWSTPWLMASTIAAVTLLLLTFISTVCSIISAIQAAQ